MIRGRRSTARLGAAMALLTGCLLIWSSTALAAAPANDDFANREVLSESLPVEVARSNVGASKESGEFLGSAFAAGHSVWFEWKASSDGWVTVGGCEADFVDVVGVFTGTAVNSLTGVTGGNDTEGPHCPFEQREYTFKATSGTKYEIAVDGNPFYMPEAPLPATEGTFELRIEATPPPANDDFAEATTFVTQLEEEDEGEGFYRGSALGYNWNAGLESGEPEHIGGANGASAWYSWTPPTTGEARISTCCGGANLRLGVYTGDSLESLELHFGGVGPGASRPWRPIPRPPTGSLSTAWSAGPANPRWAASRSTSRCEDRCRRPPPAENVRHRLPRPTRRRPTRRSRSTPSSGARRSGSSTSTRASRGRPSAASSTSIRSCAARPHGASLTSAQADTRSRRSPSMQPGTQIPPTRSRGSASRGNPSTRASPGTHSDAERSFPWERRLVALAGRVCRVEALPA
jgi:hypothetical protein